MIERTTKMKQKTFRVEEIGFRTFCQEPRHTVRGESDV